MEPSLNELSCPAEGVVNLDEVRVQLGRFVHRSILQRLAPSPTLSVAPNLGTSLRRRNSSSHLEQPTGFLMLNFPIGSCSCVACSFRPAMTQGCERKYRIDGFRVPLYVGSPRASIWIRYLPVPPVGAKVPLLYVRDTSRCNPWMV